MGERLFDPKAEIISVIFANRITYIQKKIE